MRDRFISRFKIRDTVFSFVLILVLLLLGKHSFAEFKIFDIIETTQGTKIVLIDIHNIWMIDLQQHDNYIITGNDSENVDIAKFLDFYKSVLTENKKLVFGKSPSKIILLDSGVEYANNNNNSTDNVEYNGIRSIKINPATYFAKFAVREHCVTVNDNNGWIFLDIACDDKSKAKDKKNVYDSIAHTNENIRILSQAGYKIVGVDNKDGNIDILEKGDNILFFDDGLDSLFEKENSCLRSVLFNFFDDVKSVNV